MIFATYLYRVSGTKHRGPKERTFSSGIHPDCRLRNEMNDEIVAHTSLGYL
jgi:hypothetical protein